ncbi:MAG: Hint domain-containing protein [Pseudomonadota bacterium]
MEYEIVLNGQNDGYRIFSIYLYDGSSVVNTSITEAVLPDFNYIFYGFAYDSPQSDGYGYDTINVSLPQGWGAEFLYQVERELTILSAYSVTDDADAEIGRLFISGDVGSITNVCFTGGTRIRTPTGLREIEDLRAGDLVLTRDNGPQPIRWIGATHLTEETLSAFPEKRPVEIAAGALGDHDTIRVSPEHRVLLRDGRAEALYGLPEVLVASRMLLNDGTIRQVAVGGVTYHHILFDAHELIEAEGLWSESFHPAMLSTGVPAATRDEVLELFPTLEAEEAPRLARPQLSALDVVVL